MPIATLQLKFEVLMSSMARGGYDVGAPARPQGPFDCGRMDTEKVTTTCCILETTAFVVLMHHLNCIKRMVQASGCADADGQALVLVLSATAYAWLVSTLCTQHNAARMVSDIMPPSRVAM
jgi:hypothetical protein